jgi:hypothetical protein
VRRARAVVFLAALAATLALASSAFARDPGNWLLTGASTVPNDYWQGLTSDPAEANLYFIGPFQGLWQTTPLLEQTGGVSKEIPTSVRQREGYNHIGDPTWLPGEGGRVLLPMECFNPSADPSNTCGTGSFGIADPETLAFRYYVRLDPAEIPKAMWAETSPSGTRIWTSSGDDLLAYRADAVSQANAAPSGPLIHPVKTLTGAVPPTGITGAVFKKRRLWLAGEDGDLYQVWSANTETGERKLRLEMHVCGESEGLDLISTLGGRLHWLIAPADPGCELTFGPTSALLHFVRRTGPERYQVEPERIAVGISTGSSEIQVQVTARVTRQGDHPVHGAKVRFADGHARTDGHGRASIEMVLETPGRFAVFARKDKRYGISDRVGINVPSGPASPSATVPDRG